MFDNGVEQKIDFPQERRWNKWLTWKLRRQDEERLPPISLPFLLVSLPVDEHHRDECSQDHRRQYVCAVDER